MHQQTDIKALLSRLDRHFTARLFAADLAGIDAKRRDAFFKKGILSACRADEVDSAICPLGDHDEDEIIAVQKEHDGFYRGQCKEHGRIVTIRAEQVEWVDFNPITWARVVRHRNFIKGTEATPKDVLRLGVIRQAGKQAEIFLASPACPTSTIDILQPQPEMDALLCIDLGDRQCKAGRIDGHRFIVNASDIFNEDMITLDKPLLANVLVKTILPGQTIKPETAYIRYSYEGSPVQLTVDEYAEESASLKNEKLNLFIDMDKAKVWRDGKEIKSLPTKDDKNKKRPLSRHQLRMIAHYIKYPNRSLAPRDTEAYGTAHKDTTVLSAQQVFTVIRTALGLNEIIKMGETVREKRRYFFAPPPKFKYVLLTPLDLPSQ